MGCRRCITSAKFNMKATILRGGVDTGATVPENGYWNKVQDPDTGQVTFEWVPGSDDSLAEDTTYPLEYRIDCAVRGFALMGYADRRTNTEKFEEGIYRAIEFVQMIYPAGVRLTRRDRVTNVTNKDNILLYIEEEMSDNTATLFEVKGITPKIDFFGNYTENQTILQRTEIQ